MWCRHAIPYPARGHNSIGTCVSRCAQKHTRCRMLEDEEPFRAVEDGGSAGADRRPALTSTTSGGPT